MKIARVVATVVSTINSPIYDNRRLLLCDVLDPEGRPTGKYTIAIDRVDAGAGETVLVLDEGNSARQMLAAPDAPVRAIVAGIVDKVTLEPDELNGSEALRRRGREQDPTSFTEMAPRIDPIRAESQDEPTRRPSPPARTPRDP